MAAFRTASQRRLAQFSSQCLAIGVGWSVWRESDQNRSHRLPTAACSSSREHHNEHVAFRESLSKEEQGVDDDGEDKSEMAVYRRLTRKFLTLKAEKQAAMGSYPNFTRHGSKALLPKYLTPDVYQKLYRRVTSSGVRLEDCIQAGVALPDGARPPRGLGGVYAGDADSYRVFADLFAPMITDYHLRTRKPRRTAAAAAAVRLQRHESNLNPQHLLKQRLDPEGEYILYTRMRLARSIEGFRFGPCLSRQERRKIEGLLKDCVKDWNVGAYRSVMEMTNSEHEDLVQRRLLFPNPDAFAISAGLGRDWPDARGIYLDRWDLTSMPSIMIWCNAEDHVWIISNAKGGAIQDVFARLSSAVWRLETSLKEREYEFVEDRRWGFLNSSPMNIGTALRASVYVKLVRLSRQPGFFELIRRLRLEARSEYSQSDKRFTGIYDIANAEALGKSEVDVINIMIKGVGILIDLEKKLEQGEDVDFESISLA